MRCAFSSPAKNRNRCAVRNANCVIDEIARMRYQQQVFDMMMMGLLLGDMPRVLIATTPRTTSFMKRLVAMDDNRLNL